MMKKNYLKPLCIKVPMRVQGPWCESWQMHKDQTVGAGQQLSRGIDDVDDGGMPSQNSVWDD